MKKPVIFIKIGGSLITEKDKPYTAKTKIISQIASELKEVISARPDALFVFGNGAGSFGHYPVVKHGIKNGLKSSADVIGFCEVQDGVARLNRIILSKFLKNNIPACTLSPSSIFTYENGKIKTSCFDSFYGLMHIGAIPVVYGDIIFDSKKGCHIVSTEGSFDLLIQDMLQKGFKIEKVVHLTVVDGVLDQENKVIPIINQKNFQAIQEHIYKPEGFDVTGGMSHKIQTSLENAKVGIHTVITNGSVRGNILKSMTPHLSVGTMIC